MKIIDIVKPLLYSEDTCDEVIKYFENGNNPVGEYIDLAKYFIDENHTNHSKGDKAYKEWLKELIDTERESESIILNVLRAKYQTKESLKSFVFSLNEMPPELNQKWHFFISYWGYREYITKYPEKRFDRLKPLINGDEANKGNPFKKCTEGKLWYDHMINKNII